MNFGIFVFCVGIGVAVLVIFISYCVWVDILNADRITNSEKEKYSNGYFVRRARNSNSD